jgi:hypothetical protein
MWRSGSAPAECSVATLSQQHQHLPRPARPTSERPAHHHCTRERGRAQDGSDKRQRAPKRLQALEPAGCAGALGGSADPHIVLSRPYVAPAAAARLWRLEAAAAVCMRSLCSAAANPGRHRCAQLGRSRRTAARHNLRSSRSSRRCGEQRGATCFSAATLCSVAVRMSRRVAPRIARHAAARHHACAVCGLRFLQH